MSAPAHTQLPSPALLPPAPPASKSSPPSEAAARLRRAADRLTLKVALLGDAQTGKTSMMIKFVEERRVDDDYVQTLGVNFMEKTVPVRDTDVVFSVWEPGSQHDFKQTLPLVCSDADAFLFMFDLGRRSTLSSVRRWYRDATANNVAATPVLVGTKYDFFCNLPADERRETTRQARAYAKAMGAPLVFCSARHGVNVKTLFRVVCASVFGAPSGVAQNVDVEVGPVLVESGESGAGSSSASRAGPSSPSRQTTT
jgi:GTP-binding protein of the ras superfamily involved in termination of M-phase